MRALVTGAGGMLGAVFVERLGGAERVRTAGRRDLDVGRPEQIDALVEGIDLVVNCAADTDVDGAERDEPRAFAANAVLPGLLAAACRRRGATLVHMSSTGCYGDWKAEPYTEEDPLRPTTTHHRSKAAGEAAVEQAGGQHLILRTGWLFGGEPGAPKNFVWKRLAEARSAPVMGSDAAQFGVPTFAPAVAAQATVMLHAGLRGVFNVVAHGSASRFDYVSEIVRLSGLDCVVEPRPAFARPAPVSPNETAVNQRLARAGLDGMQDWREPLAAYVNRLMRTPQWLALDTADTRRTG